MKTREFFNTQGAPESDQERDERLVREKEAKSERVDRVAMNPEMRRYLDEIDMAIIRSIFSEDAKRSGIDDDGLHITSLDRISPTVGSLALGAHNAFDDIVGLDFNTVKEKYEGIDLRLLFLRLLIHELVHSVSGTRIYGKNQRSGTRLSGFNYQGPEKDHPVHKADSSGDYRETLFENFDEGVTDKLTRTYFEEYIQRTNFCTKEELKNFSNVLEKLVTERKIKLYDQEVDFVNWMVHRISKATNFDEKMVWQAFIQSKYRGEIFEDEELRAGFDEIFNPEFLKRLGAPYLSLSELKVEFEEKEKRDGRDAVLSTSWIAKISRIWPSLIGRPIKQ